jgi:hypothetical protein
VCLNELCKYEYRQQIDSLDRKAADGGAAETEDKDRPSAETRLQEQEPAAAQAPSDSNLKRWLELSEAEKRSYRDRFRVWQNLGKAQHERLMEKVEALQVEVDVVHPRAQLGGEVVVAGTSD